MGIIHILGRGPLAGPVVAAACYIKPTSSIETFNCGKGVINDSKMTTESQREEMYELLTNHKEVLWAVSTVSHTEIDEVNILQATMNGMRRSTSDLVDIMLNQGRIRDAEHAASSDIDLYNNGKNTKKSRNQKQKVISSKTLSEEHRTALITADQIVALVDGNRVPHEMPVAAKFVIKGDGSIFSIAAASIIAKVTRDRIMVQLDKEYPQYNLAKHKGYPTAEHRALLLQHGACEIHRRSYGPVKKALELHASKPKTTANRSSDSKKEGVGVTELHKRKKGWAQAQQSCNQEAGRIAGKSDSDVPAGLTVGVKPRCRSNDSSRVSHHAEEVEEEERTMTPAQQRGTVPSNHNHRTNEADTSSAAPATAAVGAVKRSSRKTSKVSSSAATTATTAIVTVEKAAAAKATAARVKNDAKKEALDLKQRDSASTGTRCTSERSRSTEPTPASLPPQSLRRSTRLNSTESRSSSSSSSKATSK